nr:MAG TPA: hypothetical protein [Caudoviricetes sp.]
MYEFRDTTFKIIYGLKKGSWMTLLVFYIVPLVSVYLFTL